MRYTGPGVTVEVIENKRIVNVSEDLRVPAVIGMGPTHLYVTDEAVVRRSVSTDILTHTSGVDVTKVCTTPGSNDSTEDFEEGVDYSFSAAGVITWDNISAISAGSVYYVTYSYSVPSTQHDPTLFIDSDDIEAQYGSESIGVTNDSGKITCGNLTIAGNIVLENGSPAVYLCQSTSGSAFSVSEYRTAINKLEKLKNVGKVVAVFPSGSVTQTEITQVHNYLKSHCERMSTADSRKERESVIGDAYTTFATDGGHNTLGTFVTKAITNSSKRVMYLAPTRFTRTVGTTTLVLDGNYLACAVAGLILAQSKAANPITGRQLVGGVIPDELWSEVEMDYLGANGVAVISSRASVMKVRHALTTNIASAETSEDSVVQQENLVKRTLRNVLDRNFIGKGYVIDDDTLYAVSAGTKATLDSLVRAGEIRAFGQTNDPTTGEVPISAVQDSTEPRRVNVTCSYAPLYPLVWIKVTASTYVS